MKREKKPSSRHGYRGAAKVPRSSFGEGNQKNARGRVPEYGWTLPLWAFVIVDLGVPWCWSRMDGATIAEVLGRLKHFESMTWSEIEAGTGSHLIRDHGGLSKAARDRLQEIEQDDTDTLFSLRIGGKSRIFGIREGGVLRILWWDPEHEIYPSRKKHT